MDWRGIARSISCPLAQFTPSETDVFGGLAELSTYNVKAVGCKGTFCASFFTIDGTFKAAAAENVETSLDDEDMDGDDVDTEADETEDSGEDKETKDKAEDADEGNEKETGNGDTKWFNSVLVLRLAC